MQAPQQAPSIGTTVPARERDRFLLRSTWRQASAQPTQQMQQAPPPQPQPAPTPWGQPQPPRPPTFQPWGTPAAAAPNYGAFRPPAVPGPPAFSAYRPPTNPWGAPAVAPNPWGTAQPARPPTSPWGIAPTSAAPTMSTNPWSTVAQPPPPPNPYGTWPLPAPAASPWGMPQQQPLAATPWTLPGAPNPYYTQQPQLQQPWGTTPSPYYQAPQPPAWGIPGVQPGVQHFQTAPAWGTAGAYNPWGTAAAAATRRHMPGRVASGGQIYTPAPGTLPAMSGVQPYLLPPASATQPMTVQTAVAGEPAPAASSDTGGAGSAQSRLAGASPSTVAMLSSVSAPPRPSPPPPPPSLPVSPGPPVPFAVAQQRAEEEVKATLTNLSVVQHSLEAEQRRLQDLYEQNQNELVRQVAQMPPLIRYQRAVRALKQIPTQADVYVPYGRLQESFQLWRKPNSEFSRILVADQLCQHLGLLGIVTLRIEDHDRLVLHLDKHVLMQGFEQQPDLERIAMSFLHPAAIDGLQNFCSYIPQDDIWRSVTIRLGNHTLATIDRFSDRATGKFIQDVIFQETHAVDLATMVRAVAGMDLLCAPSRVLPYRQWMTNSRSSGESGGLVPLPSGAPEPWGELMDKPAYGQPLLQDLVARYPGLAKPLPPDSHAGHESEFYERNVFGQRLFPRVVLVQAAYKRRMDFAHDDPKTIGQAEDGSMPFLLRDSRQARQQALLAAGGSSSRGSQLPELPWPDPRIPTLFGRGKDEDDLSLLLPPEPRLGPWSHHASNNGLAPPAQLHSLAALKTCGVASPADVSIGQCLHLIDKQTRVQIFLPSRLVQRLPLFAQSSTAQDNGTIAPVEMGVPGTSVRAVECVILYLEMHDLTGEDPLKGDLLPMSLAVHPVVFRNSVLAVDQIVTRDADRLFITLVDHLFQHPYQQQHPSARIWLEVAATAHWLRLWRLAALASLVLAEQLRRLRTKAVILSELSTTLPQQQ